MNPNKTGGLQALSGLNCLQGGRRRDGSHQLNLPYAGSLLTHQAAHPTAQQMQQTINCFGNEIYQGLNMRDWVNQPTAASVLFHAALAAWQKSQPLVWMLADGSQLHVVICPVIPCFNLCLTILFQMKILKGKWCLRECFSFWVIIKAMKQRYSEWSLQVFIHECSNFTVLWFIFYLQWHQESPDLCLLLCLER